MTVELAVQSNRSLAASFCGSLNRVEKPQAMDLPAYSDTSVVAPLRMRANALDASLATLPPASIGGVLLRGRQSQIGNSIVVPITVDVVDPKGCRVCAAGQQPRQAVRIMEPLVQADFPISVRTTGAHSSVLGIPGRPASFAHKVASWPQSPRENAGVGVVIQALTDKSNVGKFAHGAVCNTGGNS
jgi:hypothetical protein